MLLWRTVGGLETEEGRNRAVWSHGRMAEEPCHVAEVVIPRHPATRPDRVSAQCEGVCAVIILWSAVGLKSLKRYTNCNSARVGTIYLVLNADNSVVNAVKFAVKFIRWKQRLGRLPDADVQTEP